MHVGNNIYIETFVWKTSMEQTTYDKRSRSEDNIKVDFWESNYGNVNFRQECRPLLHIA
jgi:hypothetical protein